MGNGNDSVLYRMWERAWRFSASNAQAEWYVEVWFQDWVKWKLAGVK